MSFTRSSFLHQDAGRPKQGDQPPIVLSGKPCDRLAVPLDGCSLSNLTIASTGDGKSAAGCLAIATSNRKLLSVFASLQPPIRIKHGLANVVPDPRPFFLREQAK
jgi:hypothetical protein